MAILQSLFIKIAIKYSTKLVEFENYKNLHKKILNKRHLTKTKRSTHCKTHIYIKTAHIYIICIANLVKFAENAILCLHNSQVLPALAYTNIKKNNRE